MVEDQRGWKFESWEDDGEYGNGYYTFRAGLGFPLYGVVEPQKDGKWKLFVCLEEGDEELASQVYDTLGEAQIAMGMEIISIVDRWRIQLIQVLAMNPLGQESGIGN